MNFFAKTVAERTAPGQRQAVKEQSMIELKLMDELNIECWMDGYNSISLEL